MGAGYALILMRMNDFLSLMERLEKYPKDTTYIV